MLILKSCRIPRSPRDPDGSGEASVHPKETSSTPCGESPSSYAFVRESESESTSQKAEVIDILHANCEDRLICIQLTLPVDCFLGSPKTTKTSRNAQNS